MNGQRGHDWRVSLGIWTHHSRELFEFPSTSPAIIRCFLEAAQIWKKFTGNWFWKLVSSSVSGVVCVLAGIVFWSVIPKQHVFPDVSWQYAYLCWFLHTSTFCYVYQIFLNEESRKFEPGTGSFKYFSQLESTWYHGWYPIQCQNLCISLIIAVQLPLVGSWLRFLGYETPIECVRWRLDMVQSWRIDIP